MVSVQEEYKETSRGFERPSVKQIVDSPVQGQSGWEEEGEKSDEEEEEEEEMPEEVHQNYQKIGLGFLYLIAFGIIGGMIALYFYINLKVGAVMEDFFRMGNYTLDCCRLDSIEWIRECSN